MNVEQSVDAPRVAPVDQAFNDQKRLVTRVTIHWLLELLNHVRTLGDGDILDGLIMLAINDANVRHLNHAESGYNSSATVPPDSERQPVSVYVVARELGLSYETARRHVQRLIKSGKVDRGEGGVILPNRVLIQPETMMLNSRTFNTTRKLVDQLRDIGMI